MMHPQDVATEALPRVRYETFEAQVRRLESGGYISNKDSTMLPAGISQEPHTSSKGASTHSVSKPQFKSDRRLRCQRASNYWQHSALSLSLLPVRASSRSKNLSSLIQPQFRLSQCTQANTSNTLTGRAFTPTPTTPLIDDQVAGGAASC
jgi:hypothetical protein